MKPMHLLPGLGGAPLIGSDPSRFRVKDEQAELKTLQRAVSAQKSAQEKAHEIFENAIRKANDEIAATKSISEETKSELGKVTEAANESLTRLKEVEQELVKFRESRERQAQASKSVGELFTENDGVKRLLAKESGVKSASMQFKSITSATTGTGDAGVMIVEQRVPGVITQPNRPPTIRQLLGAGATVSNAIEYVRETGFTNLAAPVAEGAVKPESSLTFELLTAPVRTIAHWMLASVQVLDDVPMLMSYINSRLLYGLELEEEAQLLNGDGTGQNISGLIPNATAYNTTRTQPGDTRIDILRRAMTQVRIAEYMADAIVLHPDDWEQIELTKTSEGAYVWASPANTLAARLWGLPVVTTTVMEPGEFLVGNFRQAAAVWDRQQARVDVAMEDVDNFRRNMVTIRAEQRLALTVYRPEAYVFGDFDNATI